MSLKWKSNRQRRSWHAGTPDYLIEILPDGFIPGGAGTRGRRYRARVLARSGRHVVAEAKNLKLGAARDWCRQQTEA